MADEITRTQEWLYDTLTADTALTAVVGDRVYSEAAPLGSEFPLVVFGLEYPEDVLTHNGSRIMVTSWWRVRGIVPAESFSDALQTIADRIDAILHRSDGGTADGAVIFTSVRMEPYMRLEVDEGKQYRSLGGVYKTHTQLT